MAPHLSPTELDLITTLVAKKLSASDILGTIKKHRVRSEPMALAMAAVVVVALNVVVTACARGRRPTVHEARVWRVRG